MTKLSDTQLVILSAAAQRADLSVLPLPDRLNLKGGALNKVMDSLRNRADGNPFATDDSIRREIEDLTAAYLATRNDRVARLIKVELDLLETLI